MVISLGRKALFVCYSVYQCNTVLDLLEAASTDAETVTSETGTVDRMGQFIAADAGIVPLASSFVSATDLLLQLPSSSWNLYCSGLKQ